MANILLYLSLIAERSCYDQQLIYLSLQYAAVMASSLFIAYCSTQL
jgi:hypothetical protein